MFVGKSEHQIPRDTVSCHLILVSWMPTDCGLSCCGCLFSRLSDLLQSADSFPDVFFFQCITRQGLGFLRFFLLSCTIFKNYSFKAVFKEITLIKKRKETFLYWLQFFFILLLRGVGQVLTDYIHGSTMPKVSKGIWLAVSIIQFLGLCYFNYADVGICKAVSMIWHM